ncbi:MAG TPA: ribosome-associated translation inhibitor RaiA [Terriglobales bacterium]|nr:ribosome-associated translation inhibitor RaiA [Terriglobales bacterium]
MNVEFTGRQYEVTLAVRKQVEHGLSKLEKILGKTFDTHVILSTEKKRHIAEITVTIRNNSLVGVAEAADMPKAVGEAIEKIDRQAVKYKTKFRAKKRIARKVQASSKWNGSGDPAKTETKIAVGTNETTAVDVVVHSFPGNVKLTEAHVVRSEDSVAMHPMTIEEAVKEAEFRDREVFVFRDPQGKVKVLHRKKDGKMELIEAP